MSSMFMVLKLVMALTMNALAVKALFPPNKTKPSDTIELKTFGEKYMPLISTCINRPVCLIPPSVLCAVVFSTFLNTPDVSTRICPKDVNNELSRLSPAFWGIFLLISGGASIRLLCYRTLGKFFTYEITIRPNHQIVDVGPYAIVRHASYTGLFMILFGSGFLMFGSPSPIIICGWAASSGFVKVFMGIWSLWAVIFSCWIINRLYVEEGNLSRHFGQAWKDYTKRIPYRLIPGIF